jgi:hypothetical protein
VVTSVLEECIAFLFKAKVSQNGGVSHLYGRRRNNGNGGKEIKLRGRGMRHPEKVIESESP